MMAESSVIELTRMSSKGQVVIPQKIRDEAGVEEGSKFVVYASGDTIFLKKLFVPDAEKSFKEMTRWAFKHAKKLGLKEKDVDKIIRRHRGLKEND